MSLPSRYSFADLGGTKVNYSNPVDSSTDYSADNLNAAFSQVAAMNSVSPTAILKVTFNVVHTAPQITSINSFTDWIGAKAPTITYSTTGTYDIIIHTDVTDQLGVARTYTPFLSIPSSDRGGAAFPYFQYSSTGTNTLTYKLYIYGFLGSLLDPDEASTISIVMF